MWCCDVLSCSCSCVCRCLGLWFMRVVCVCVCDFVCVCVNLNVCVCTCTCTYVHVYVTMCFDVYLCVSKFVSRLSLSLKRLLVLAKRRHAQSMKGVLLAHRDVLFIHTVFSACRTAHSAPHTPPTHCTPTPHRTPHTVPQNNTHTQTDRDLESCLSKSVDVRPQRRFPSG